ncbi:hypothetical protein O6H91_23G036100 [Diphasiastrum complanatum]|uniref:Uncharacterized protein n=1 Tax=Diphasiastrum complanatum TaxID=34168 RepID=A0ACC2ABM5_DIPCM|nr:hypothetical protein O6H91_23G036100 [Diphasiastrum complanatum]
MRISISQAVRDQWLGNKKVTPYGKYVKKRQSHERYRKHESCGPQHTTTFPSNCLVQNGKIRAAHTSPVMGMTKTRPPFKANTKPDQQRLSRKPDICSTLKENPISEIYSQTVDGHA